uniref:lipase maturation factor 1 isoform X2 n=1 Tax=Nyctereutes procyonoides TaxID=34880 RepID=UPI002444FD0D|nr:lipase maturation factor 1 isoform X2 [Nyctereutes procyonoides]
MGGTPGENAGSAVLAQTHGPGLEGGWRRPCGSHSQGRQLCLHRQTDACPCIRRPASGGCSDPGHVAEGTQEGTAAGQRRDRPLLRARGTPGGAPAMPQPPASMALSSCGASTRVSWPTEQVQGWESQLLETGFLGIFLCPLWTLSQLPRGTPPSQIVLWGFRWLIFRIMLGATQPVPNPVAYFLHQSPWWVHRGETLGNHFVELVVPFFIFLGRRMCVLHGALQILFQEDVKNERSRPASVLPEERLQAWVSAGVSARSQGRHRVPTMQGTRGCERVAGPSRHPRTRWQGSLEAHQDRCSVPQAHAQVILIISGNLSFLNWLTMVPSVACFDDATLGFLFPSGSGGLKYRVLKMQEEAARGAPTPLRYGCMVRRAVHLALAALVAWLSVPVVLNLLSPTQIMNTSFNPLRIVNTYGAFGSITKERTEVILQGTAAPNASSPDAVWEDYEFKCKPGDPGQRPCLISPYHYRLDWLMWFAAFQTYEHNEWIIHLAGKLLANDASALSLLAINPFEGRAPPRWLRGEHYRYKFSRPGSSHAAAGKWWLRKRIGPYFPPVSLRDLEDYFRSREWPHPAVDVD